MANSYLHRMQKIVAITATMGLLLLSNTVAAGFADEYQAKHPRRVKTTISQDTKGQLIGKAKFKLFDRSVNGFRVKLEFDCNTKGPDLILLSCSTFGGHDTPAITELSCGDGENKHNLHWFTGAFFPIRHHSFGSFAIANINPKEFDNAIVLSANNYVIMNNSHKHWQEFQQALTDAGKLYEERREIWKKLNDRINNPKKGKS